MVSCVWRACMTGHDPDFKYIIGHYSLKSLYDLLVSVEFRNLIGCGRREERDSNKNASSYAEHHRLRSGPFLFEGPSIFYLSRSFPCPGSFTFQTFEF